MNTVHRVLLFLGIVLLGASLRLYGLNWDQSQHLHPDERFLTQVTNDTKWPSSISQYFDTTTSPLNPHNANYGFFVYGTFPIFLVKLISELLGKADYTNITLVGRAMSAIIDTGTIILVFFIAKKLFANPYPLFAAFFYALMPLPIQLSHFYATDPYLVFFLTASMLLILSKPNSIRFAALGIIFGLAVASKITAVLFLPIIGLAYIGWMIKDKKIVQYCIYGLLFVVLLYITIRLAQPYLFNNASFFTHVLNPKVLANWKELKSFDGPQTGFPPALQWIPTKPISYSFLNLFYWGLGVPLGLLGIISILLILYRFVTAITQRIRNHVYTSFFSNNLCSLLLITLWVLSLFLYQSVQFAKTLRYLYPLVPFLAILTSMSIVDLIRMAPRKPAPALIFLVIATVALWTWSFLSIYQYAHSRVQASEWIYQHIPSGSTVAQEHWDDGLPLPVPQYGSLLIKPVELTLYNPDTPEKWSDLSKKLAQSDYIFITSNRLWRSLSALPKKYPYTKEYYEKLFDGRLGFRAIQSFTSYPCLLPGRQPTDAITLRTDLHPPVISFIQTPYCTLAFNDDGAEESFTVYDHPKVILFQNTEHKTPDDLYTLITNKNL